jgi:hypothetical protein
MIPVGWSLGTQANSETQLIQFQLIFGYTREVTVVKLKTLMD